MRITSSREEPPWPDEHQHDEESEGEHIGQLGVGIVAADGDDLADDE